MKVYIAGPYTKGDVCDNVRKAIFAAEEILSWGHLSYVPHLTHLWHLVRPHNIEFWYAYDIRWLEQCDVLVRLPGESKGADEEVRAARDMGMKVFLGLGELKKELRG